MKRVAITVGALLFASLAFAETRPIVVAGVVVTPKQEVVQGATVTLEVDAATLAATTDEEGRFRFSVPAQPSQLTVTGKYLSQIQKVLTTADQLDALSITVTYRIPPAHESLVISASALDPTIDRRNGAVYANTLFNRDDQLMDTLAAGINAGQHEGGGKSLEIRRFGFNLDHGGVNGGLKVLVDDIQQNQSTQGHGQGYLGALKSLTPELVEGVDILNGPFSAEYGDFSGLGVVHIRLRESLADEYTARIQGGSFGGFRTFLGWSPKMEDADSFVAYEGSHSDGPFLNPLRYNRNNVTANYTRHLSEKESLGLKFNLGTNDFYSSGQIPTDLVDKGSLNRFGYVDPYDGGRVRLGTAGIYYRKELTSGDIFKADAFVGRSLFDLYSNFTYFLKDPVHGDEFQQHDSRLQEGANLQYLHPNHLFGKPALLTVGFNFHDNQINVGLLQTEKRVPYAVTTSAHAHVTNFAGYAQQGTDLLNGRLHLDVGLRYDHFRFAVDDRIVPSQSGVQGAGRIQPKANLAYSPSGRVPLTLYASYGRGISSEDARGVVQRPKGPRLSTTDFFELGDAIHLSRVSLSSDVFLIDRSNEQVYIPDDGSFEFKGPSRAYGWEAKTSVQLASRLSFNAGLTQVSNAFYRGTSPRVYVNSAPHTVGSAALTLAGWQGFFASLRYRHISAYRLDGLDPSIRATGLDVMDFSVTRRVRHGVELNFAIDNLNDKRYWETQNYFESQVTPTALPVHRIHATPGAPIGFTVGLTFHAHER